MKKYKPYIISFCIAFAVAIAGGRVTYLNMSSFEKLIQPLLSPPGFLFPIVWTILYVLMGIGSYLIYKENDYNSSCCLKIYVINLFVNFLWSPMFFGLGLKLFSFIWIIILDIVVLYMIVCYYKVNKKAAYLQIPYLIWSLFATYLNLAFYILNR